MVHYLKNLKKINGSFRPFLGVPSNMFCPTFSGRLFNDNCLAVFPPSRPKRPKKSSSITQLRRFIPINKPSKRALIIQRACNSPNHLNYKKQIRNNKHIIFSVCTGKSHSRKIRHLFIWRRRFIKKNNLDSRLVILYTCFWIATLHNMTRDTCRTI